MRPGPQQLRDWMERRSFNQEEAARYLGIVASVMTKLVNGTRNAGLKIALIIERKTGIPVEAWASPDVDTESALVTSTARKPKSDK